MIYHHAKKKIMNMTIASFLSFQFLSLLLFMIMIDIPAIVPIPK